MFSTAVTNPDYYVSNVESLDTVSPVSKLYTDKKYMAGLVLQMVMDLGSVHGPMVMSGWFSAPRRPVEWETVKDICAGQPLAGTRSLWGSKPWHPSAGAPSTVGEQPLPVPLANPEREQSRALSFPSLSSCVTQQTAQRLL